jgi:hypothetical protein
MLRLFLEGELDLNVANRFLTQAPESIVPTDFYEDVSPVWVCAKASSALRCLKIRHNL